jgi:transcriptional regulator with GAF, ATPase, and Fis domain
MGGEGLAAVRSVLWIGRGEHFAAELVADTPTLDVVWEREAASAARLAVESFHAIVLDADDADHALASLAQLGPPERVPVLVRLADHDARRIPELRAAGAADALLRCDGRAGGGAPPELLDRIERLSAKRSQGLRHVRPAAAHPEIVGLGPEMARVFELVAVAARSRATALLTGETGTGKELVARAIHDQSGRRAQGFVAVNCAAFPDTLLESELFGHVRGAFTGADRANPGLFEVAHGGTLFLDEVGETSGPFQAKLLRVLQEREVRPVGGSRTRQVEVRVIAASNRNLCRETRAGGFREDLYYRLAVFPIHLPPLRERPRDVIPLALHFLELHGQREGHADAQLSAEAERLLLAHRWPGNVRELENEVQRALAMAAPGEPLGAQHFSERLSGILEPVDAHVQPGDSLRQTVGRIEAFLIRRALDANGGRRAETARRLGITREGLYKKMKRFNIE